MGVGGQRHAPATLPPRKRPGTHCIRGWVGPRAGLDRCGKISPPLLLSSALKLFIYEFWLAQLFLSIVSSLAPSVSSSSLPSFSGHFSRRLPTLILAFLLVLLRTISIYIQGVPGGKDLTSGQCSLGQTIPI
jgi:hypothetical protein